MEPTGVKRKLAAILAADVEGYARLMRADEEATLKTLKVGSHPFGIYLFDRSQGKMAGNR